jgi:hypothetical protein
MKAPRPRITPGIQERCTRPALPPNPQGGHGSSPPRSAPRYAEVVPPPFVPHYGSTHRLRPATCSHAARTRIGNPLERNESTPRAATCVRTRQVLSSSSPTLHPVIPFVPQSIPSLQLGLLLREPLTRTLSGGQEPVSILFHKI